MFSAIGRPCRRVVAQSQSQTRRLAATALVRRGRPVPSASVRFLVLRRGSGLLTIVSLVSVALGPVGGAAACAGGRKPNDEDDEDAQIALRRALDAALGPTGGDITFGFLAGCVSGYALKKVGKAAALVIGVAYLTAQTLSAMGYVDVNWAKLERQVMGLLGQDADAKLTRKDLEFYVEKLKKALQHQLPSTGGFVTGFALGVYKG